MKNLVSFEYCPACAESTLIVNDDKSLKCSNCGWLYYHNTAAAVGGLIVVDNKILLCRRACNPGKGLLDIPGGFVDYDETIEMALAREMKEEVSLNVTEMQYFRSQCNTYQFGVNAYKLVDSYFVCSVDSLEGIQAGDDAEALYWIALDELDYDAFAFDSVKAVLRAYVSAIKPRQ